MSDLKSKKSLSRLEFANLAGVSAAAVTKACKGLLVPALDGKRIDAAHPIALKYIADHTADKPQSPAIGIDPLYEKAAAVCFEAGRYSARFIRETLNIGTDRSTKILAQMTAAGLVPVPEPKQEKPISEPEKPVQKPEKKSPSPRVAMNNRIFEKLTREATLKELGADDPPPLPPYPENISDFIDYTLREILDRFGTVTSFNDWLDATKTLEMIEEKRLKNAVTKGELIPRILVKNSFIDPINSCHIKLLTDGAKTITRRVTAMHGAGTPLDEIEKFVIDNIASFIKPVKAKIARALSDG